MIYRLNNGLYRVKINKENEYAEQEYLTHKIEKSDIYNKAVFEVWHNNFYTKLTDEEIEEEIKKEFKKIFIKKLKNRKRIIFQKGIVSKEYYYDDIIPEYLLTELEITANNLYKYHKEQNHPYYKEIIKNKNEDEESIKKRYIVSYVRKRIKGYTSDTKKELIDQTNETNLLKKIRKINNLGEKDTAFELEIDEQYYEQIENQKETPTLEILYKIENLFSFSADTIAQNRKDYVKIHKLKKLEKIFLSLEPNEQDKIIEDCEFFASLHKQKV